MKLDMTLVDTTTHALGAVQLKYTQNGRRSSPKSVNHEGHEEHEGKTRHVGKELRQR